MVENAINHGIDKGVGNGSIRLRAAINGTTLIITVEDDGIGIDQEGLEQLRERLKTSKELGGQSGNGLLNVHRRILLHYGEGYGITLESMPYQGLKVSMTIPVQRLVEPPTI